MQNVLQKDYPKLHTHACTHARTHTCKQEYINLHWA